MRSAVLAVVGQMTSSRQSPNRSADSDGVALEPLLEWTPLAVSSRESEPVPYLSMRVWSSSSRTGSPSHQTRKLIDDGSRPMAWPAVLRRLVSLDDHDSAPGLPAHTSPDTPRPLSPAGAVDQMTCPVRASARYELGL